MTAAWALALLCAAMLLAGLVAALCVGDEVFRSADAALAWGSR